MASISHMEVSSERIIRQAFDGVEAVAQCTIEKDTTLIHSLIRMQYDTNTAVETSGDSIPICRRSKGSESAVDLISKNRIDSIFS